MFNIGLIINFLLPGAVFQGVQWGVQKDFDAIIWLDARAKPLWSDITSNAVLAQQAADAIQNKASLFNQINSQLSLAIAIDLDQKGSFKLKDLSQPLQDLITAYNGIVIPQAPPR